MLSPKGLRWLAAGTRLAINITISWCALVGHASAAEIPQPSTNYSQLRALGQQLFFDPALSANGQQSCATCHDPEQGFHDARTNGVHRAASLGSDGHSLGDRNTPSIAYAALVPDFKRAADGEYLGGLFLDGRAHDLAAQALEPPLNPLEMAQPTVAALVEQLLARPHYRDAFGQLFGQDSFADHQATFRAMARAIAAFERGPDFLSFDSAYDRYLAGTYQMTALEERGRRLFFSDLTNCMLCHLERPNHIQTHEPFTDHRYHNIGLPRNESLRRANGRGAAFVDVGLLGNPAVDSPSARGKFRTPSLRNVAVTGPYMHNGNFSHLATAIFFYNRYIVLNDEVGINPETKRAWGEPEVAENIALDKLREGQPLADERITALIAFLRTLTDQRYEHLLPPLADNLGEQR